MITTVLQRRRAHGEDGVTLVIALAFVMVLGAVIVALLALTETASKATKATSASTDTLYAADGGADFALEEIRTTSTSACPPTVTTPPAVNAVTPSLAVACTGGSTSGSGSQLLGAYSAIALGTSASPWAARSSPATTSP